MSSNPGETRLIMFKNSNKILTIFISFNSFLGFAMTNNYAGQVNGLVPNWQSAIRQKLQIMKITDSPLCYRVQCGNTAFIEYNLDMTHNTWVKENFTGVWQIHQHNNIWRHHQIETFSGLLALCVGNSPVTGEFPTQRPVTRSFDFSLICAWINGRVNNREAGDLRRHRSHY